MPHAAGSPLDEHPFHCVEGHWFVSQYMHLLYTLSLQLVATSSASAVP